MLSMSQDITEKYLEFESWQIKAIKRGIKDVKNGDTVSIEDIKAEWNISIRL